jgi:SSS family solute:Na+ symporter
VPWFSTVLMTATSFYMWPHVFGSSFSARNSRTLRRNAIFMPLYELIMLFAFFVGFAAILSFPGLEGSEIDLSLLRISLQQFDLWVVGLIGAAGLVVVVFTLGNALDLVLLALLGSSHVTQLLLALLFSLAGNNFATKWGAGAGIVVGVGIVTYLTITGITLRAIFPSLGSLGDINVGVVALLANVLVLVAVSLTTRTSTANDEAGASPGPTRDASRRGRS